MIPYKDASLILANLKSSYVCAGGDHRRCLDFPMGYLLVAHTKTVSASLDPWGGSGRGDLGSYLRSH